MFFRARGETGWRRPARSVGGTKRVRRFLSRSRWQFLPGGPVAGRLRTGEGHWRTMGRWGERAVNRTYVLFTALSPHLPIVRQCPSPVLSRPATGPPGRNCHRLRLKNRRTRLVPPTLRAGRLQPVSPRARKNKNAAHSRAVSRKKLAAAARRCEGAHSQAGKPSVTFCEREEEQNVRAMSVTMK